MEEMQRGGEILIRCSEVLTKIRKVSCNKTLGVGMSETEVVTKLEEMHGEIECIQESVEKSRQFKEGQELYTEWLRLAKGSFGDKLEDYCGEEMRKDEMLDTGGTRSKREPLVSLVPLVALAYNNRGYLKYLQVDFEGAIQDYTASLKYNPGLPTAYYNRGVVTYRLAFFEQAYQDMNTAVKLQPNCVEFLVGLEKTKEMLSSPIGHKFQLEYTIPDDF